MMSDRIAEALKAIEAINGRDECVLTPDAPDAPTSKHDGCSFCGIESALATLRAEVARLREAVGAFVKYVEYTEFKESKEVYAKPMRDVAMSLAADCAAREGKA